jgi:HlyD family secretion protein
MSAAKRDPEASIRRLQYLGLALVASFALIFGGWATMTELSGAVIAPGTIVVESNVKKVQHPYGGVVKTILVREGSDVKEDQTLIQLDDTVTRSTLGVVQSQLDELMARRARLTAERDGAEALEFPPALLARRADTTVGTAITGEERLFESRRSARTSQRAQLRERISQIEEEIRGLSAQRDAKEREIELISEEVTGVSELYSKKLVTLNRLTVLQRDQARLQGERGQLIAEMARARGKISETEIQLLQLDHDFRTDVLKDLREAQGKIAELSERRTAAEDELRRIDIKSSQAGVIHQLNVHTVGGVIGKGETIAEIVPVTDKLVVEAKVSPQDIDQLRLGTKVALQIQAGNRRTLPNIDGTLVRISADLNRDAPPNTPQGAHPTGAPAYYLVRIELSADEVKKLDGLTLLPGMQVEAFMASSERTPLQYLLKPLQEQIARTFRER